MVLCYVHDMCKRTMSLNCDCTGPYPWGHDTLWGYREQCVSLRSQDYKNSSLVWVNKDIAQTRVTLAYTINPFSPALGVGALLTWICCSLYLKYECDIMCMISYAEVLVSWSTAWFLTLFLDCVNICYSGQVTHSMVAHLEAVTSLSIDNSGLYLLTGSEYMYLLFTVFYYITVCTYRCLLSPLLVYCLDNALTSHCHKLKESTARRFHDFLCTVWIMH